MGRRNTEEDDNGFAEWGGYMAAKKAKLLDQFTSDVSKQSSKSDLFKGVAIFVNGYTKPSAEELKSIMCQHGGVYHIYQISGVTTHIIASNLPNVKIKQINTVPIVKPEWISESLQALKLLDFRTFLLYTNASKTQPRLDFTKKVSEELHKPIDTMQAKNDEYQAGKPQIESVKLHTTPTLTATDPNFISEFYNNSRLHLIATLGAEFKQLVSTMRSKSNGQFNGKQQLIEANVGSLKSAQFQEKVIMHIDMDCFFVSVGLRQRPELRGKPVAVTHAKGNLTQGNVDRQAEFALYAERFQEGATSRIQELDNNSSMSEIASCSYEARKFGIKNGMFLGAALRMCPDLRMIPYDFQGYREVSSTLYAKIASYTLDIEAVSCDEMYVDITSILQHTNLTTFEWADHIRNEIMESTGCPCSTGFGANRLQARLATRKAKPAGKYHLKAEDIEEYLFEIPLSDLPGVGRATLAKLRSMDLHTCGDVQSKTLGSLRCELGQKNGETLFDQVRGIDKKPLNYKHERKSVSAEVNYGIRFKSNEEALTFIQSLSEEVCTRLKDTGMRAKCVTLKLLVKAEEAPTESAKFLGHGLCDALTRSTSTNYAISDAKMIYKEVGIMYERLNILPCDLRGVGIKLSRLEKAPAAHAFLSQYLKQIHNTAPNCDENNARIAHYNAAVASNNNIVVNNLENTNRSKLTKKQTLGDSNNGQKVNKGKRGRLNKAAPKDVTANNLNKYFKSTKTDVRANKKLPYISMDIDMSILNELPAELRIEIMNEYQLASVKNKPSTSEILNKNDGPTSQVLERNISVPKPRKAETGPPNQNQGFHNLGFEDLKKALRKWIQTEKHPTQVDMKMLGEYLRQLALDGEIEKLRIIIKFLHRNVDKTSNCIWHDAYFSVLSFAQEGMIFKYGNTLLVPREFNCMEHNSL